MALALWTTESSEEAKHWHYTYCGSGTITKWSTAIHQINFKKNQQQTCMAIHHISQRQKLSAFLQGDYNNSQTPVVNMVQTNVDRSSHSELSAWGTPSSPPGPLPFTNKYNIVVRGIPERSKVAPRHKCLNEDFCKVNGILQKLDPSVQVKPCMQDCRQIGKYDASKTRPRPVLVTLSSTAEVVSVLC